MNPLKTLSFTACALLASAGVSNAFFTSGFNIIKYYRQGASGVPDFRKGSADLFVIDGTFTYTVCARNGIGTTFGINTMLGCNIGSNALVLESYFDRPSTDFPNGDGIFPDPQFYEIVGIEAASVVEPGHPDEVILDSRPVSTFPGSINSAEVVDVSTTIYYDLIAAALNDNLRQYDLADYRYSRTYSSRKTMESEIVPGIYKFKFPTRIRSVLSTSPKPIPTVLTFPVQATIEGLVQKPQPYGFQFVKVNPFNDGFAEYDPRVTNTFYWAGLSTTAIANTDKLYVSFRNLVTPADPTSETGTTLFPPGGTGLRINLPSPRQDHYTLPPGFSGFGTYTVLEVALERQSGLGTGAVSQRLFELPIHFVNTLPGAMAAAFPAGTPAASMAKDADPDGDGISNWVEWLSGTDPTRPNPPATLSPMSFVSTAGSGNATKSDEPSGFWEMSLARPAGIKPTDATVIVESSLDLKSWTKVSDTDPQWTVIDNPEVDAIRVVSKTEKLTEKRYFRVRFTAVN